MIRISLFLFLSLFCAACGGSGDKTEHSDTSAHEALPPRYYFYPKANVYFDSVNKDYVFMANDGKTWTTEKQIPAVVHSLMDKGVLLDSPAQPVWKDNADHRLIYAAVLYASPTDTVEKIVKPAPKPVDTVVKKEERKGGIRGFFSRLFGKKKKEKKEGQ